MATQPPASARLEARVPREQKPGQVDRRSIIIAEAARLFARQGFEGTSMRELAAAAGILPGSIYYHFPSKEELFVAVIGAGMEAIEQEVREAIVGIDDPWKRLEAAAAAHCRALLQEDRIVTDVGARIPSSVAQFRDQLVAQRDAYEEIIASLVADLDLDPRLDRRVFRLNLLGALNWTTTWYRPHGGLTPEEIGEQLVRALRAHAAAALA